MPIRLVPKETGRLSSRGRKMSTAERLLLLAVARGLAMVLRRMTGRHGNMTLGDLEKETERVCTAAYDVEHENRRNER
jgi:hypothetical protein